MEVKAEKVLSKLNTGMEKLEHELHQELFSVIQNEQPEDQKRRDARIIQENQISIEIIKSDIEAAKDPNDLLSMEIRATPPKLDIIKGDLQVAHPKTARKIAKLSKWLRKELRRAADKTESPVYDEPVVIEVNDFSNQRASGVVQQDE